MNDKNNSFLSSQPSLLIVDDDPFIRRLMELILSKENYKIDFAVDGSETLEKARKVMPDVILLDAMMPKMDGFEVCEQLRNDFLLAEVPIIMVTVLEDHDSRLRGLTAGVDDFITKPFHPQLLKAKIDSIIRLNRYKRLLQERAKLTWVVNLLSDGIIILDEHKKIILMNNFMIELLKAKEEHDYLGKSIELISCPDNQNELLQLLDNLFSGKKQVERCESCLLSKENENIPVEITAGCFQWHDAPSILITARDLSILRRAEQAHQEIEVQHRKTLDEMGDAIHVVDKNLNILYINKYFKHWIKQLNIEVEEPENKHLLQLFPFLSEDIKDEYQRVFSTGDTMVTEESVLIGNEMIMTETRKIPIFQGGKVTRVQTVVRNVTARKNAELALIESEENFKALAEKSPNMIFINHRGRILYVNEQCVNLMGYTREDFYRENFDFMSLIEEEDRERVQKNFMTHLNGKEILPYEYSLINKDGQILYAIITTRLITFKGNKSILGIVTDISERKRAEAKIIESLREKELLLREVQHRVKNNLQVIMSLLRIQSRKVADHNMQALLKESQDRVMSLALIHDKLYQSQEFERINLQQYLQTLSQRLHHSYGEESELVKIHYNLEDISLNVDQAIPIGLVVNELLSNAFKHAFPSDFPKDRKISISLVRDADKNIILTITDNGIGFQSSPDIGKESLGIQLVNMLTSDQLKGSVEFNGDGGSQWIIRFNEDNNK